jgi:AbrB family looped-hinge helix DNA binding protein
MTIQHRLTSKAQVTIPKDVRDELGVKPGDMLRFDRAPDGKITIAKGDEPAGETADERQARILKALEAIRGKYPNPNGMTTDEYMLWLRGDHYL